MFFFILITTLLYNVVTLTSDYNAYLVLQPSLPAFSRAICMFRPQTNNIVSRISPFCTVNNKGQCRSDLYLMLQLKQQIK